MAEEEKASVEVLSRIESEYLKSNETSGSLFYQLKMEFSREIERLKLDNYKLSKANEDLKMANVEITVQLNKKINKIQDLKKELSEYYNKLSSAEVKIQQLSSDSPHQNSGQLEVYQEESVAEFSRKDCIIKLMNKSEQLFKQYQQYTNEYTQQLNQQVTSLQDEVKQLSQEKEDLTKERNSLKEILENQNNKMTNSYDESSEHKLQINILTQKNEEVTQSLQDEWYEYGEPLEIDVPPSLGAYPPKQSCSQVVKRFSGSKTDLVFNYDDDDVRKSQESGATMEVKSTEWNGSHRGRSNGTSRSKASLKNNSEISESNDITDTEQFSNNKSCLKTDKIHTSDKISASEVSHNKFSSKACDKIESGNDYFSKPSDNKRSLKTDESKSLLVLPASPCNSRDDEIINRSENQISELFCNEQSTVFSHLNEDKNVKIDIENKNLCAYDSDFPRSNANVARKNKYFQPKDSYKVSVSSMQENVHAYKANETPSNHNKSCTPNVEAKEFVPTSRSNRSFSEYSPYDTFDLENLLKYTAELMDEDTLTSYAFALKNKVLEKLAEFGRNEDELDFLCQLTDGDQSEKNQKLICARMCLLAKRSLKHMTSPNFRKPYGHQSYTQNSFSGRKYHLNK